MNTGGDWYILREIVMSNSCYSKSVFTGLWIIIVRAEKFCQWYIKTTFFPVFYLISISRPRTRARLYIRIYKKKKYTFSRKFRQSNRRRHKALTHSIIVFESGIFFFLSFYLPSYINIRAYIKRYDGYYPPRGKFGILFFTIFSYNGRVVHVILWERKPDSNWLEQLAAGRSIT